MSLKATKIPEIPALSSQTSSEVRRAFEAIRGFMRDLRGKGGVMAAQDLLDSAGSLVTQAPAAPRIPMPLAIANFTATGAFNSIVLQWDAPLHAAYVEIWRNTEDVLGTALFIGTTEATVVSDVPPDAKLTVTYYYWVRAVNGNGIVGPWNDTAGTAASTANDPAYLIDLLSKSLDTVTATINATDLVFAAESFALRMAGADPGTFQYPFIVAQVPGSDPATYAVYMDAAYITNLTATNFVGETINADTVSVGIEISAPVINGGEFNVGPFAISSTFSSVNFSHPTTSKTMLQVDSNGNAVFGGNLNAAGGTFSGHLAAGVMDLSAFEAVDEGPFTTPGNIYVDVPVVSGWSNIRCKAIVIGAGGGGGGGYANSSHSANPVSSGGGGGAGSLVLYDFAVAVGNQVLVTVGSGGTGGAAGIAGDAIAGVAGDSSSVNYSGDYSASGGGGGGGGTYALAHSFLGGAGGSLGGARGSGAAPEFGSPGSRPGGNGGSSAYGSGGIGAVAIGGTGLNGGGGGGGGANCGDSSQYVFAGGPGGSGYVMLQFYDANSVVLNARYTALIDWLDGVGHGAVPSGAR